MKVINLVEQDCCNCGTRFSMEEQLYDQRKKDGKSFYCPNGHGQLFCKSDAATISELKEEVDELTEDLEAARVEVRQLKCQLLKYEGDTITKKKGILSWLRKRKS